MYFLFKKVASRKTQKRGHLVSLNVFTNRKFQKKERRYPLIEFEKFRKKVA